MDDRMHVRSRSQDLDVNRQLVRDGVAVTWIGAIQSDEPHVVQGGERETALFGAPATNEQVIASHACAHMSQDVLGQPGVPEDPAGRRDLAS